RETDSRLLIPDPRRSRLINAHSIEFCVWRAVSILNDVRNVRHNVRSGKERAVLRHIEELPGVRVKKICAPLYFKAPTGNSRISQIHDVTLLLDSRSRPSLRGIGRIGAGEVLEKVFGSVQIRIGVGERGGRVGRIKIAELPRREAFVTEQIIGDPAAD